MSLAIITKLSLTFLGKRIFHEIGLQIEPGDMIGLVGPNGSGKTTLLRLINGEISPDTGEILRGRGIRIGYLPQDVHAALSGKLLQSILDSIPGRLRLSNEIIQTEKSLKNKQQKSDQLKLAGRLAELHQEKSYLDTQFSSHEAKRILAGLGFQPGDFTIPVSSLSEGWRMRAVLGSLLYQRPDLLLLDEPTNHLDIPSVHWLEQFLQTFKGAIMLVCHDRDFLNKQINRIISLESEGMKSYRGNYDFYLKVREEERLNLEARARNQEQKIKDAQKFIERFRYKATKARQAQSKIKLLKKMELVESRRPPKTIHFSFPVVPRSGREVVAIKGVSKGFNKKTLYKDINISVLRGERIAIIGPNGSGKTTLLRMIAGEIKPDHGEIIVGHKVIMSYFAQHHLDMLNPGKTILEEVNHAAPTETIGFLRGVCGTFLFSGDDVDKSIGILSGGEKARVSLAKLLVKPGNLMLMDEPTNHLDLISSEILTDALADYRGTLIFVSHNQSFVNRLATKIWDIKGEAIEQYPGNLNEYYDHLERISKISAPIPEKKQAQVSSFKDKRARKAERRKEAEKRSLIRATLKPIQDKLTVLEDRIADLEKREKELEKILSDPDIFADKNKSLLFLNEYRKVREKSKELIERWESGQNQLETAKRSLGI
ncbi:MAG: ATP-binding cassette domain-containing protein [Deltaproteobacteria bacterium]|nr:ATP-binding cassette domain-containing protein [Deltaproteobacteria bacterium]